jgi:hypothetical protein
MFLTENDEIKLGDLGNSNWLKFKSPSSLPALEKTKEIIGHLHKRIR